MGRRLLILLLEGATREDLEDAVETRGEGGYPSVYLVVPANVGALEWLATDEKRAQSEADVRALEAEWLLADHAEVGGGESGHADPVQAVGDALERFEADEVVVVGDADDDLLSELRALGRPVVAPGGSRASTRRTRLRASTRAFTSGRGEATPWVAFLVSNFGFLVLAVAFALLATLIVWLAT